LFRTRIKLGFLRVRFLRCFAEFERNAFYLIALNVAHLPAPGPWERMPLAAPWAGL
jgi:hypothetical protein